MSLFQLLKYFPGDQVILGIAAPIWGSLIVPGAVFGALMLLPFIGALKWRVPGLRWRMGDLFSVTFLILCIIGFMLLTYAAFDHDWNDPHYADAVEQAERDAARVKALIKENEGIPPEGALALLRNDPHTQGPRLFEAHCASCHGYGGENGLGELVEEPSAADLKGFASRAWLTRFFSPDHIVTPEYWGNTKFVDPEEGEPVSKMVDFVLDDVSAFGEVEKTMLEELIIGLSAEAELPYQEQADAEASEIIARLPELIGEDGLVCTDCHQYQDQGRRRPKLTGYGSREWMMAFIKDPTDDRFYGDRNDRMPSYGPMEEKPAKLSEREIGLIVDWLRAAPADDSTTR